MTVAVSATGLLSCMVITSPTFGRRQFPGLSGAGRTAAVSPGPSPSVHCTHNVAMRRFRSPSARIPMSHRSVNASSM